jgi:uncharacterized protein involved in type VI secretion and phage assembly
MRVLGEPLSSAIGGPRSGGAPGLMLGIYLAKVVSVKDDQNLARVQVRLFGFDGVDGQDAAIWARVAVPFAGSNMGAFFLPGRDDEVAVQFVNGDPRLPIVIGSLWNGNQQPPEQLGGSGEDVDRWSFKGKNGSRIAIVEEQEGQATVTLETPGEVSAVLKEESGGKIEIKAAGATVTIDSDGVTIDTPSKVSISGSTVEITAGQVTVNAATANFSGLISCQTLQTDTVIATTYTTGAGNIW